MEFMESIFKFFWGKPISVLVFIFMDIGGSIPLIPNESENWLSFIIYFGTTIPILIVYVIYVIKNNSLPCCEKNAKGVLFVFRVVTQQQYEELKYLVEQNFLNNVKVISNETQPVCLFYSDLIKHRKYKNYNINNLSLVTELLKDTNCFFCVEFFIETDKADSPSNYLATINTGLLPLETSDNLINYLKRALYDGNMPIQKIAFNVDDKIDKLKLTTTHLSILSEYIVALVYQILDKPLESVSILEKLFKLSDKTQNIFKYITKTYYESSLLASIKFSDSFWSNNNPSDLDKAIYYLESANVAIPDQYEYHLGMARMVFLKNRDVVSALAHIKRCKEINKDDHWKYSEAFLYAYTKGNPNVVYQKYRDLKGNSYNRIEIIDYIEKILVDEPNKYILNLALGILYENHGDKELSSCNYKKFLECYTGVEKLRIKTTKLIQSKISFNVCKENKDASMCQKCALKQF